MVIRNFNKPFSKTDRLSRKISRDNKDMNNRSNHLGLSDLDLDQEKGDGPSFGAHNEHFQ